MADLFDKILPVVTLLIGAALTGRQGVRTRTAAASDRARDLLAEHPARIWDKSDEGWVKLQIYLSTMRGPLRTAGVSLRLVQRLSAAITDFWSNVEHSGDSSVGLIMMESRVSDELEAVVEDVYLILENQPSRWEGLVAWARRNKVPPAESA